MKAATQRLPLSPSLTYREEPLDAAGRDVPDLERLHRLAVAPPEVVVQTLRRPQEEQQRRVVEEGEELVVVVGVLVCGDHVL